MPISASRIVRMRIWMWIPL